MPGTTVPPSIEDLARRLPAFCRSHGIARVEVFGSVAAGEAKPGSDLDLMVTLVRGCAPVSTSLRCRMNWSNSLVVKWIS
jgi:predicted nucleotidyltransferase